MTTLQIQISRRRLSFARVDSCSNPRRWVQSKMSGKTSFLHLLLQSQLLVYFLDQEFAPVLKMVVSYHDDLARLWDFHTANPGSSMARRRHLAFDNWWFFWILSHELFKGVLLYVSWIDLHFHHYLDCIICWGTLVLLENHRAHSCKFFFILRPVGLLWNKSWRALRDVK